MKPALLCASAENRRRGGVLRPGHRGVRGARRLRRLARAHGIVLTPHTTTPLPRDELLPSEEMLLKAGIYNLGFIAVGRRACPFLDCGAERLRRDCLVAVEDGVFVDQRWVDFVPALFEHVIARDTTSTSRTGTSYRELARERRGWEVDGRPLRFFNYSGLSLDRMNLLSAHMGSTPRILLADQPELRVLCDAYADSLRNMVLATSPTRATASTASRKRLRIDPRVRRDVRQALFVGRARPSRHRRARSTPPRRAVPRLARRPDRRGGIPRYLSRSTAAQGDVRHRFPT